MTSQRKYQNTVNNFVGGGVAGNILGQGVGPVLGEGLIFVAGVITLY